MRHLFALLALALGLAACDDSSTTAPVTTDAIPGPPNAPLLTVTVLTGTKAAPVDSPTVKIAWAYKDWVQITLAVGKSIDDLDSIKMPIMKVMNGIGDTLAKIDCANASSIKVYSMAYGGYASATDSTTVYCK